MAPDEAIVVALGSNMAGDYGSPEDLLEAALEALARNGIRVIARSRLWRSKAWPDPALADYLNAVCLVETKLSPPTLMATLHWIEREFGRTRNVPNAPRTLDLDLIAYGRTIMRDPVLPHPRAADRLFVMGPLAELLPDWSHPVSGERAGELIEHAIVGQDAKPLP